MTAAREMDTSSAPSQPFQRWQQAAAALKAAEGRGAPHDEIVRLSAAVIRARNTVTVDRMQAGWRAPDDVLSRLTTDDQLLLEKDDVTDLPGTVTSTTREFRRAFGGGSQTEVNAKAGARSGQSKPCGPAVPSLPE